MSEPTGPRVMLLGSGELSRELTTALRHLGAEVTAVNDDVADADPAGVSAQLARLEPDFVVTVTDSISDAALAAVEAIEAVLARTDEEFTELVPSARSVRLTTDREGLRGWPPTSWACPPRRSGSSGRSASSRRWPSTPGSRYC